MNLKVWIVALGLLFIFSCGKENFQDSVVTEDVERVVSKDNYELYDGLTKTLTNLEQEVQKMDTRDELSGDVKLAWDAFRASNLALSTLAGTPIEGRRDVVILDDQAVVDFGEYLTAIEPVVTLLLESNDRPSNLEFALADIIDLASAIGPSGRAKVRCCQAFGRNIHTGELFLALCKQTNWSWFRAWTDCIGRGIAQGGGSSLFLGPCNC